MNAKRPEINVTAKNFSDSQLTITTENTLTDYSTEEIVKDAKQLASTLWDNVSAAFFDAFYDQMTRLRIKLDDDLNSYVSDE